MSDHADRPCVLALRHWHAGSVSEAHDDPVSDAGIPDTGLELPSA